MLSLVWALVFLNLVFSSSHANPPDTEYEADATITVEAHRNIEVYVAPPEIINMDESIEAFIGDKAFIQYASAHYRNAKIKNERGTYEPITMHVEKIYFYDIDTISIAWPDCNYRKKAFACSVENDHYFLQPHIEIDSNQLVIRLVLYDSSMQIVGSSTHTDNKIIKWIKQQEIIQQQTSQGQGNITAPVPQPNCTTTNCTPGQVSVPANPSVTVTTTKPKEELPLKWEIPHQLLNKHVHQASLKLWTGLKF